MIQYQDQINRTFIFLNQIVSFVDHEIIELIWNKYDWHTANMVLNHKQSIDQMSLLDVVTFTFLHVFDKTIVQM